MPSTRISQEALYTILTSVNPEKYDSGLQHTKKLKVMVAQSRSKVDRLC